MHQRQNSGFTLIEMVITLTVLAILTALAVPSFRDLMDKSRLRGATDDVINLLNLSRANAVKLQRDVNLSVKTASGSWCVGAISAPDPTVGEPIDTATACDCAATTVECLVNGLPAVVSSSSYATGSSTAALSSASSSNQLLKGKGGITFNSKFGALDLSSTMPTNLTVKSPLGTYSTQISVSALGEIYVCASPFVSGYPSC